MPKNEPPVDVAVAAWEWGKYLGHGSEAEGVDVCVSSWQRMAPNTLPAMAKAGGNYLSSQLISMEAKRLGFAEGIALDHRRHGQRGRRREPVPGQGRRADHTGARALGARRHHARHRHAPGARSGARGARMRRAARAAVPRRRAVLHRHRRRGHADPLGRPHRDRRGQARPDHRDDPAGLLRPVRRPHRGPAGAGSTTSTWPATSRVATAR